MDIRITSNLMPPTGMLMPFKLLQGFFIHDVREWFLALFSVGCGPLVPSLASYVVWLSRNITPCRYIPAPVSLYSASSASKVLPQLLRCQLSML